MWVVRPSQDGDNFMSVGGGTPGIVFRSVVSGSSYLGLLHLPLLRHFVHLRVWALLIYESSEMYEYNTHAFLANVAINAHTRIVATRNRPEYFSLYNSKRNLRIFSVSTVLDVTERDGQTVQFNEPLILTVLVPSAASACINVKIPVMPCTVKCIYDPPSYAEGWLHCHPKYTSGCNSPY
jgi:hypothetical protein